MRKWCTFDEGELTTRFVDRARIERFLELYSGGWANPGMSENEHRHAADAKHAV
jgi:hypothetical protein